MAPVTLLQSQKKGHNRDRTKRHSPQGGVFSVSHSGRKHLGRMRVMLVIVHPSYVG